MSEEEVASTEAEGDTVSRYFLFFAAVLALVLLLSKFLHTQPKLSSYVSESALTLLVGMSFSLIVSIFIENDEDDDGNKKANSDLTQTILSFPTKVFFLALLPPILFNSGYQLQRELFYRHFKPIVLFSALGTTISGVATSCTLYGFQRLGVFNSFDPTFLELLVFGSLIAATDTVSVLGVLQTKRVDPHLFSLVFGESALNDAVAIVLFRSFSSLLVNGTEDGDSLFYTIGGIIADFAYQAIGSPLLGVLFAFLIAMLFKWADLRTNHTVELSLFILLMYFPFILAEECSLSGIVAIFFAGLSAKRYIEPNVSDETKKSAEVIFHLISYLAETCIFLELGFSVFGLKASFDWGFIGLAVVAALFGRAVSIYPISFFFNWSLKERVEQPQISIEDDTNSVGSGGSKSTSSSWSSRKRRTTPWKRKDKHIPVNFMHMMWFAGLRGAVAYACAREFPDLYGHKATFNAATVVIVLFTIVVMGGFTESMLFCLGIRMNVDEKEYMKVWRQTRGLKGFYHDLGTWTSACVWP